MVFFKDYTFPSSKLKYLIIETEDSMVETKFLVQDSLVGRYVDPWPQLRNTLHMRSWTSEYDHKSNKASKVWYLEKSNPQRTNIASTLSNIGRCMIQEELRWGDNIVLEGEYHCISGNWEWTKDVLSKNGQSLNNAYIRDAVFASLFTYDRNSNIIQAFCEVCGVRYEEVIPNATELTCFDGKRERFLPRICEIPTEINTWLSTQEMVFSKLGAKHQKYETYLTTFLQCWLRAFVFPSEEGNFIRSETFKMASLMASGRRVSLAVPVLASIYHGLNKMSNSSQLDHIRVCFLIHYVYGCLAYYLKTHYPLTSGPSLPRMVVYSGEGAAKFFDKDEARKRVHRGKNIVWNATMLSRPHPTYHIDDGKTPELELVYFMSLRFNYLPLRRGCSFVIEPYSATMSKVTFPHAVASAKKLYTTQYSYWWERSYGMFLEDNLDVMVEKAGSKFVTLLEDKSQDIEKTLSKVKTPLAPQHQSKKLNSSKASKKQVVHTSTDKEKFPQFLFSSKRAFQETNKTSKDRCWKRQRVEPSRAEVVDLRVVEVQSVDSPSRSLTIQSDKAKAAGHLLGSPREGYKLAMSLLQYQDLRQNQFQIPSKNKRRHLLLVAEL
ncbi:hypothetical protein KY284_012836 [Solanum tuberosum]|nr:hypothetical protein KY284_012836 [Solanum tuberosum]